jgi:hypothetical protein
MRVEINILIGVFAPALDVTFFCIAKKKVTKKNARLEKCSCSAQNVLVAHPNLETLFAHRFASSATAGLQTLGSFSVTFLASRRYFSQGRSFFRLEILCFTYFLLPKNKWQ